jgi:fatty acid desaturase (delta-4 desaturase)
LFVCWAQASEYRGPNTSADEDLVFCLRTSSAQPPAGVPQLPSGTVVGGVAAAALQRCELTGVPAVAVIAVEGAPVPDAGLVCSLAAALCKALPSAAARQGVRGGGALHAEVAAAVDSLYRSSASESMFI